ncbi:carboxymuconolactone decarboxylase family protein [Trebonia sp.]|uniref:carboxymuconolactone decarboxylase family protein n=1 Tax=Trebonia sp. TaxID=2767075 RepID=UPI002626C4AA|nr:carboxymuconolactone decarboxylase family protein [Trebonia sp.]
MTESSDRTADALATMRRIFGAELSLAAHDGEPESAGDLHRILFEHAFADSWSRTHLDDRSRSLITVAMLAVIGAERELRNHVAGAMGLGVTADELVDLFIHVGVYAGVAQAHQAWSTVSDVIEKVGARRAATKPAP